MIEIIEKAIEEELKRTGLTDKEEAVTILHRDEMDEDEAMERERDQFHRNPNLPDDQQWVDRV